MANPQPILLVEDNPDDEALTLRALSKSNILNDVVVAHDGAEALDGLFAGGDGGSEFVLVLLDLNLPEVDGLAVLRRIRASERTRVIPVVNVMLTSSRQEEDIIASYRNGSNVYVRKPVQFFEFAQVNSTLGAFWLLINQAAPAPLLPSDGETGHERR